MTKVSKWDVLEFEQLTSAALYSILAARMAVFVVEQDCPYQDADGLDDASLHVCGWSTGEKLLAYARITPPGSRFDEPAIGRVLTLLDRRGEGMGHQLMEKSIAATTGRFGNVPIRISAQRHLQSFYNAHGFRTVSAPYDEDGIEHVEMLR